MMEAKTPKEFFEEALPARFKPDKAEGIDVTAQLNLVGSDGGDWVVVIKDQKLHVKEGTQQSPALTLKIAVIDFMNIVNGKLSAEKAFFMGKINFKGSLSLALKLRDAGFL
jgi:putative sterol carrier protein